MNRATTRIIAYYAMIFNAIIASSAALMLLPFQASAMDMKVEGQTVILSGSVAGSECDALGSLLSHNKIATVVLTNSGGETRARALSASMGIKILTY